MTIGPDCISNIPNLSVNGSSIMCVDSLSYLGVVIIASKKFKVDLTACRRQCFAADNCIYNRSNATDHLIKCFFNGKELFTKFNVRFRSCVLGCDWL